MEARVDGHGKQLGSTEAPTGHTKNMGLPPSAGRPPGATRFCMATRTLELRGCCGRGRVSTQPAQSQTQLSSGCTGRAPGSWGPSMCRPGGEGFTGEGQGLEHMDR